MGGADRVVARTVEADRNVFETLLKELYAQVAETETQCRKAADLRDLCNRQARKIGDTRGRRQADLELLITDIVVATGLERRPVGTTTAGRLRHALLGLALAFVTTVALGVGTYVAGYPLADADLAVVWLLLFVVSQAWAWRRRRARRGREGPG